MQTPPRDAVESYLQHLLKTGRYSTSTLRSYRADLEHYKADCTAKKVDVRKPTQADTRVYVQSLSECLKPSSLRRRISVLRYFYQFLIEQGCATSCPLADVVAPPYRELEESRPPLTGSELEQLLDAAADGDSGLHLRDVAIIRVLSDVGLLASECAQLSLSSFDAAHGCLRICDAGRLKRVVPLSSKTCASITDWLTVRHEFLTTSSSANVRGVLFLGYRSTRLTERSISRMIANCGKRAGHAQVLCAQSLRNTCATRLSQEGRTTKEIQDMLGHVRKDSTRLMLKRL